MSKTRKKRYHKLSCSPKKNSKRNYSCYTDNNLKSMKKFWNARHPDVQIKVDNPKDIWRELRNHMSDVCNTERCWLKQKFMKNHISKDLINDTFAPKAPSTWKSNPDEWLTSLDIDKVMKQWEKIYDNYEFIGPTPIDFDKELVNNQCVWDELCKFSLSKYIRRGKTKIGIIFNLDPHYKSGSHWTAMYLDTKDGYIFYFDSNGDKCPKQVKKLAERIIEQGKDINLNINFLENHPVEHQQGDTECGIYTIYVITQLLSGKKKCKDFMKERIPDEKMLALRSHYFNIE